MHQNTELNKVQKSENMFLLTACRVHSHGHVCLCQDLNAQEIALNG